MSKKSRQGRDARSITSRSIRYPSVVKNRLSRQNYYDRLPAYVFTKPPHLHTRVGLRRLARRATLFTALSLVEDRRRWAPTPLKPVKTIWGHQRPSFRPAIGSTYTPRKVAGRAASGKRYMEGHLSLPVHLGFRQPHRIALCIRRKSRREVILAIGRGGGGGAQGSITNGSGANGGANATLNGTANTGGGGGGNGGAGGSGVVIIRVRARA